MFLYTLDFSRMFFLNVYIPRIDIHCLPKAPFSRMFDSLLLPVIFSHKCHRLCLIGALYYYIDGVSCLKS